MHGITGDEVNLGLKGVGDGMFAAGRAPLSFSLPLKKGCRTTMRMSQYHVDFVIEDDRYLDLRAGIGISIASSTTEGFESSRGECP
jgi:hypothetical protein